MQTVSQSQALLNWRIGLEIQGLDSQDIIARIADVIVRGVSGYSERFFDRQGGLLRSSGVVRYPLGARLEEHELIEERWQVRLSVRGKRCKREVLDLDTNGQCLFIYRLLPGTAPVFNPTRLKPETGRTVTGG
jgi:hypothetical protein